MTGTKHLQTWHYFKLIMPVATCILILTFTLQKLLMNQMISQPSQLPLNTDVEFNVAMFQ